jgi:hypothetical protein
MRRIKHKKLVGAISVVAVLALAGAALAFWSASGVGSGNASTGTDSGVTIDNTAFSGTIYPGTAVGVAFDVTNPSLNTAVNVYKVVADTGVLNAWPNGIEITAPANAVANCDPTWFTYSEATLGSLPSGRHIAANSFYHAAAGTSTGQGGTLLLSDLANTNQDACKSASLTLHLKIDNTGL